MNDASRGFKGSFRQSMSWLHTWSGLVLGIVLYFMFVTGTVGYFNSEVDRWMRPELPLMPSRSGPAPAQADAALLLERAAAHLHAKAPMAKAWYLNMPLGDRNNKFMGVTAWIDHDESVPHADEHEDDIEATFDPRSGERIATRATGGGEALYAMHFALHYLPERVAMYTVGVATMAMLVAIFSGIVVHKKIFRDFFTFRPAKGQRSWLDAHNLSSVMALPFMVMITYSGLVFYTYDYMPSVKAAAYGVGAQADKAFSAEQAHADDETPSRSGVAARLAPWPELVAAAQAKWGSMQDVSVRVDNPGDTTARVIFSKGVHDGLGFRTDSLVLGGSSAQPIHPQPASSLAAPAVDRFAQLMLDLHEGEFAGPALRWLYFFTGALGAAMVATGMVLWVAKRRQQLKKNEQPDAGLRFIERLNVGAIAGLMVGIAVYFWANRLLPVGMAGRAEWEMHALFIAWVFCLSHGLLREPRRAWLEQLVAAAALYGLIPLLNGLTTHIHLGASVPAGDWVIAGFDLTALALGIAFALAARRLLLSQTERFADSSTSDLRRNLGLRH